jgi:hypothetical protein
MNKVKPTIIIIVSLTLLFPFILYPWLILAGLDEFKDWYPRFGLILWAGKNLFFLSLLYSIYFFRVKIVSLLERFPYISIFVVYVVLSWVIGEHHPFSRIPMYHSFPNYAYTFNILDNENQMIPLKEISKMGAAEISHLYFSAINNSDIIYYGSGIEDSLDMESIGEEVFNNIVWKENIDLNEKCFKLERIYLSINESNELVTKSKILYESCY